MTASTLGNKCFHTLLKLASHLLSPVWTLILAGQCLRLQMKTVKMVLIFMISLSTRNNKFVGQIWSAELIYWEVAHILFWIPDQSEGLRKVGQNLGKTGSARGRSSFFLQNTSFLLPCLQLAGCGKCNMRSLKGRRDINGVHPLSQILEWSTLSGSKSKLQHHSSTSSCLSLSPFWLPANQGAGDWRARAGSRGLISNCSWWELLVVARARNRWRRGNSWYSDSLNIGPRLFWMKELRRRDIRPLHIYHQPIWKETPYTLRIFLKLNSFGFVTEALKL